MHGNDMTAISNVKTERNPNEIEGHNCPIETDFQIATYEYRTFRWEKVIATRYYTLSPFL